MFSDWNKRAWDIRSILSLLVLSALLFSVIPLHSQEDQIRVESTVDKSVITVGDLVTYTLTITRAESVDVRPPEMGANLGQFEIRDYEIVEPQKTKDGLITETYSYSISVYDVGQFQIPPVAVFYTNLQGKQGMIESQVIDITVNSVKPSEAEDIIDIKPPVTILGRRNLFLWGGAGLGALLVVLILLFLWKRKRAGEQVEEKESGPPRPAHEIAYEELARIEGMNLLGQGLIKTYYTELSDVIRRYIGRRYRIITMELTTAELIESMEEEELNDAHIEAAGSFLDECDLVKFAKFIPPQEVMRGALQRAREIVDATRETILDAPMDAGTPGLETETEPVEAGQENTETELVETKQS